MAYAKPLYEKSEVDEAGNLLLAGPLDEQAFNVVNNWRSSHAYPLNSIQMTLRNRTKRIDDGGIVAQRIKRLSSTQDKLRRYGRLRLSEMQDVGGCRVVVRSVERVYQLVNKYKNDKRTLHQLADEDDYIRKPKPSGYRGYHLIYEYNNPNNDAWNGQKIEMQLRSELQHIWATAVETADVFLQEGLKSNRGSADWRRFFALMGSAIATREDCKGIPRTPKDHTDLISELREYVQQLDVITRLSAYGGTLQTINAANVKGAKYLILRLDPSAETTTLYGYKASESDQATELYLKLETQKLPGTDVVLISLAHAANLRRAYPNYFLDTSLFLEAVKEAIS